MLNAKRINMFDSQNKIYKLKIKCKYKFKNVYFKWGITIQIFSR